MQPLYIQATDLVKKFDDKVVVDHICLSVSKGEVLGFLGPNGAGKTTTMRMLTGFFAPNSGSISICGYDIINNPSLAKINIGYMPEGAPLYGDMTALQYLNFICDARRMYGHVRAERLSYVIDRLSLRSVLYEPIENLSKGYRARVCFAQAIIHDPKVLILDEPTDGLDPVQKHEVRQLIKEMSQEKAIVISTHILEEVDAVCTRAIIIAQGKIMLDKTPEELAKEGRLDELFRRIVA